MHCSKSSSGVGSDSSGVGPDTDLAVSAVCDALLEAVLSEASLLVSSVAGVFESSIAGASLGVSVVLEVGLFPEEHHNIAAKARENNIFLNIRVSYVLVSLIYFSMLSIRL